MYSMSKIHTKTLRKLCSLAKSFAEDLDDRTRLNDLVRRIREKGFSRAVAYEYARALMLIYHSFYENFKKSGVVLETLDLNKMQEVMHKAVHHPYCEEDFERTLPFLIGALNWAYWAKSANPVLVNREFEANIRRLNKELRTIKSIRNGSYLRK